MRAAKKRAWATRTVTEFATLFETLDPILADRLEHAVADIGPTVAVGGI